MGVGETASTVSTEVTKVDFRSVQGMGAVDDELLCMARYTTAHILRHPNRRESGAGLKPS